MPRRMKKGSYNKAGDNPGNDSNGQNSGQGERQSIYFPKEMAEEIKREAIRQDRSISWIVQKAWRLAKPMMKQLPSANELENDVSSFNKKSEF